MTHLVYGLIDPRTEHFRYVGKSTRGLERPKQHTHPYFMKKRTHCATWVRSLVAAGPKPVVVVLEETTAKSLNEVERFWIGYLRFIGCELTNHTPGGEGTVGLGKSTEARAKLSAALKGRMFSAERKANIAASKRGVKLPASAIAKLTGRVRSPEQRARISEAATRRWARVRTQAANSI